MRTTHNDGDHREDDQHTHYSGDHHTYDGDQHDFDDRTHIGGAAILVPCLQISI